MPQDLCTGLCILWLAPLHNLGLNSNFTSSERPIVVAAGNLLPSPIAPFYFLHSALTWQEASFSLACFLVTISFMVVEKDGLVPCWASPPDQAGG